MNLDEYKSKRNNVGALMQKLQEQNQAKGGGGGGFKKDERIWSYTKGSDGNALAVIRFLPSAGETAPVVSLYKYGFRGPNGWFIENCPSTLGEKSPVLLYNSKIIGNRKFDDLDEATKTDIRSRSRKKEFYANILVIKDSANPSNEGKVFLWKFPQTIYDKVVAAGNAEEQGEDVINPFSPLEDGSNFKLKVKTVGGFANYDQSIFMEKSALPEEMANKALEQIYDLGEFISPKNFKSFLELEEKFNRVMGFENEGTAQPKIARREDIARPTPKAASAEQRVTQKTPPKQQPEDEEVEEVSADDFFADLK